MLRQQVPNTSPKYGEIGEARQLFLLRHPPPNTSLKIWRDWRGMPAVFAAASTTAVRNKGTDSRLAQESTE
ncbi:hypothetical protein [Paenibacillus campi]|uniref:hypothetical protein n=1 Tax=Paenibacillus campi TaxID=3106031 RepID=UPI002B003027|nr:hypothetical protein [Paenibacillus sp. SGZ-1009]